MKKRQIAIFVLTVVCQVSVWGQSLEIPSRLKNVPEKIIRHKAYTLSFNNDTNCPNWVAWELTDYEVSAKRVKRSKEFLEDPQVDAKHRLDYTAYRGSGYSRGHMCPAGDNKWDSQAMSECFYMSNMCPQDKTLNGTWWEHVESACRRWAQKEGSIYIVCGPIYKGKSHIIGKDKKVRVPDGFFKVVLSMRKGNEKAIGFYFDNDGSRQTMEDAACSVDTIEKLTGIDFFPSLDDKTEKRLESEYKLSIWK